MIPIQPADAAVAAETEAPAPTHDLQHYLRPGTLQLTALPPLSLYVHLPWCIRKCPYCDFNSHEMRTAELPEQRYLDALMADLEAALPLIWGCQFIGTPKLQCKESLLRTLVLEICFFTVKVFLKTMLLPPSGFR